jgi:hypothetical protein
MGWAPSLSPGHDSEDESPFDYLIRTGSNPTDTVAAAGASQVIRSVFKDSPSDVALFMDQRGSTSDSYGHKHIVLPFFGGADDRAALHLVVQLCLNPRLSATIVRLTKGEQQAQKTVAIGDDSDEKSSLEEIVSSGFTIATVSSHLLD